MMYHLFVQMNGQTAALAVYISLALPFLCGCGLMHEDASKQARDGIATSLYDVEIGDPEHVIRDMLGEPSSLQDKISSFVMYRYDVAGASYLLHPEADDVMRVGTMCAYPPYEGDGHRIGLGMQRSRVVGSLGEPSIIREPPVESLRSTSWVQYDTYRLSSVDIRIAYDETQHVRSWCIVGAPSDSSVVEMLRHELGVIRQLGRSERYVIQPVAVPSERYGPDALGGDPLPEEYRVDGLKVVFSANVLQIPSNVRLHAMPIELIDIQVAGR